uniref:phospholipase ABHD3-like n=1 Tax=Styela clava TaxID=7725 RepID=UPI00193A3F36|nr:phospholipase ABHD3-like [Styela clava]
MNASNCKRAENSSWAVYVFVVFAIFSSLSGVVGWAICLIACCGILYWHKYWSKYGKIPLVACKKNTKLDKFLERHISTFRHPYMPLYWCPGARAITIIRYFVPCVGHLELKREILHADDGGIFGVDWCHNKSSSQYSEPSTRPTIIIVPGLSSTPESGYIKSMTLCLVEKGFRVVVLIYRGLGNLKLKTPKTHCATHTSDLATLVDVVHERFPNAKLYCIGASLGALIVGRYMSERGDDVRIDAGLLFACSFHPPICMEEFELWSNKLLLNFQVTQGLKENYRRHSHVFESVVDHEKVEKSAFLRDFDTHFTAPVFGYKTTEDYFNDSIFCGDKMENVKRPLLCVNSNDDPFSPERGLPKMEVTQTENVALVMTYGGGHVSHLDGWNPFSKSYFEKIMVEYFDAMIQGKY